jgi:hypothetical protein
MDGTIDGTAKAKVVAAGGLGVSLVDRIAGEDNDNDQMKTLAQVGRTVLGPWSAAGVANNGTLLSDIIDLKTTYPNTRRITVQAAGSAGNVQVHASVSEDYTNFAALTADTTAAQYTVQKTDCDSSAFQAIVTNKRGSAQDLLVWVVLGS